jgi:hypothetical protein
MDSGAQAGPGGGVRNRRAERPEPHYLRLLCPPARLTASARGTASTGSSCATWACGSSGVSSARVPRSLPRRTCRPSSESARARARARGVAGDAVDGWPDDHPGRRPRVEGGQRAQAPRWLGLRQRRGAAGSCGRSPAGRIGPRAPVVRADRAQPGSLARLEDSLGMWGGSVLVGPAGTPDDSCGTTCPILGSRGEPGLWVGCAFSQEGRSAVDAVAADPEDAPRCESFWSKTSRRWRS